MYILLDLFLNIIHLFYNSWRLYYVYIFATCIFYLNVLDISPRQNIQIFFNSWIILHSLYHNMINNQVLYWVTLGYFQGFAHPNNAAVNMEVMSFLTPCGLSYKTKVFIPSLLSFPLSCHYPDSLNHPLGGSGTCYLAFWVSYYYLSNENKNSF